MIDGLPADQADVIRKTWSFSRDPEIARRQLGAFYSFVSGRLCRESLS